MVVYDPGFVKITGGLVKAYGGGGKPGISTMIRHVSEFPDEYVLGSVTIEGGEVYAYGKENGVGIGEAAVTISGGKVHAFGSGTGAGIGAVSTMRNYPITITWGFVETKAGEKCYAWNQKVDARSDVVRTTQKMMRMQVFSPSAT